MGSPPVAVSATLSGYGGAMLGVMQHKSQHKSEVQASNTGVASGSGRNRRSRSAAVSTPSPSAS